jgi:uncharacterized cupin superfamily protein
MAQKREGVVNLDEIEPRAGERGTKFGFRARRLGPAAGSKSLGCSWYEVPPGRSAFPHHFHCANEEAVFILSGSGEARIGHRREAVRAGDYIAFPIGPDHAHSLRNTGAEPLRYLAVSTMAPTDVIGYPDSKKIAAVGARDLAQGIMSSPDVWLRLLVKEQENADYYDGEDTGA